MHELFEMLPHDHVPNGKEIIDLIKRATHEITVSELSEMKKMRRLHKVKELQVHAQAFEKCMAQQSSTPLSEAVAQATALLHELDHLTRVKEARDALAEVRDFGVLSSV